MSLAGEEKWWTCKVLEGSRWGSVNGRDAPWCCINVKWKQRRQEDKKGKKWEDGLKRVVGKHLFKCKREKEERLRWKRLREMGLKGEEVNVIKRNIRSCEKEWILYGLRESKRTESLSGESKSKKGPQAYGGKMTEAIQIAGS